jgi:cephalosporin hydroxylase
VNGSFVTELLKNEEVRRTAISAEEGALPQKLVAEKCPKVTVEVGLGHGVSALFICEAGLSPTSQLGSKRVLLGQKAAPVKDRDPAFCSVLHL